MNFDAEPINWRHFVNCCNYFGLEVVFKLFRVLETECFVYMFSYFELFAQRTIKFERSIFRCFCKLNLINGNYSKYSQSEFKHMLFDYDFMVSVSNDKIEQHHQLDFVSHCQIPLNMFDPDSFDSFFIWHGMIEWVLIEWRKQNITAQNSNLKKSTNICVAFSISKW